MVTKFLSQFVTAQLQIGYNIDLNYLLHKLFFYLVWCKKEVKENGKDRVNLDVIMAK